MKLGDLIDRVIEPFAPSLARKRQAERMALEVQRQYDVAAYGRRTQGWRRTAGSADREIRQGLKGARNAARELVRNNKVASAALRIMTSNVVGDGISARAQHPDEAIRRRAQDEMDRWAESKVDGFQDWYGCQKLLFRGAAEGGDMLQVWEPDDKGPDGFIRVLEGDYLDETLNEDRAGHARIEQGVEFDDRAHRAAYWLFDQHPGHNGGSWGRSRRFLARHVDHVFEPLRAGQARGISWFAPVAMDLRDIQDAWDARLMQLKVSACLALVLTPGEGSGPTNPFGEEAAGGEGGGDGKRRREPETIRPGMILRARPGETATTVQPPAGGDSIAFIRQQIAAVSANLAPYHLISGDVSQANYSSLRAALLGFWANLDDWQQNMMIPFVCNPAFQRRMARLALDTGDTRFLQVKPVWAPPPRRFVDPLKDGLAEKLEIRSGFKSMPQSLSERGLFWQEHVDQIAEFLAFADEKKVVFDTDARRVDGSGGLQPAVGYLAGNTDNQN
ncbi:phage portal protein [Caulobacter vibrioides]|uniref:Phage portal protein n=1 Tax=Caulobacter vibrioides TaxID=155892 RepID=A0A290N093_CAUVI|nr:phage portal protein [Caulobacter vibrioides]ATC34100.1 phage portal protein [Caulobacter vibrioides]